MLFKNHFVYLDVLIVYKKHSTYQEIMYIFILFDNKYVISIELKISNVWNILLYYYTLQ